jgi:hypothetical protein
MDEDPRLEKSVGPKTCKREGCESNLGVHHEEKDEIHTPGDTGEPCTVGHQDFRWNGGSLFRFSARWLGIWC